VAERPTVAALRQPQGRAGQCAGRPTKENDVNWVYTRLGLPVEIIAEYENWSRIRDWEAQKAGSCIPSCPAAAPPDRGAAKSSTTFVALRASAGGQEPPSPPDCRPACCHR